MTGTIDPARIRHPEKANRPDNVSQLERPDWIRVKAPTSPEYAETLAICSTRMSRSV